MILSRIREGEWTSSNESFYPLYVRLVSGGLLGQHQRSAVIDLDMHEPSGPVDHRRIATPENIAKCSNDISVLSFHFEPYFFMEGEHSPPSEVGDITLELGVLNAICEQSHNNGDRRGSYSEPDKEHPVDERSKRIGLHA